MPDFSDATSPAPRFLRPEWADRSSEEADYFDHEWGRPVVTEHGLLERICLEGFQSGLSWATILRKRRDFRDRYFMFDPARILAMSDSMKLRVLSDEALIRNPRKHDAVYANAAATLALREDPRLVSLDKASPARAILGEGLANRLAPGLPVLVWSFTPERHERPRRYEDTPSETAESRALAQALKAAGFRFVGPTTCYALMQAIGMVDDRVLA